jgi:RNA polymerase sigma-70 factor (ECF subfamily)
VSGGAWEQELVARIAAGDDSALATACDQYGALVNGVASRLVGSDLAADVCQDVFVALWDHPERFDPGRGNLRTFQVVLARRRSIDLLRRHRRRRADEGTTKSRIRLGLQRLAGHLRRVEGMESV